MRSRLVLVAYCVWMTATATGYLLLPGQHLVMWALLALSCSGAIVVGIIANRPAHPLPWWLLAVGVTTFAAGDTTYNILTTLLGQDRPFPSLADVFYLAMYPALAIGLGLLIRARTEGNDSGSMLDALSLTVALALLSWIFLIDPYVQDPEQGWLERAISIGYPLGDIVLLAVLARLLILADRNHTAVLLGAGTAGLLVSDVFYGLGQVAGTWRVGSAYDLGWVAFYLAWGVAALDPSMTDLTKPVRRSSGEISVRRVALLMAASLIAPGALLVESLGGGVGYGVVIAVFSAVFFLLVLFRVSGVVARYGRTVARERTLRSAGAAMLSAKDDADVVSAVESAVAELAAPAAHRCAVLLGGAAVPDQPGAAESSRLVLTAELDGPAAAAAAGSRMALVCPLVVSDRVEHRSVAGLLVVGTADGELFALRGALEVLAGQAAQAIERLALAREVGRRDSEAYFRTLVHHSHDVVLIVDDDGRVRYASPSARTVLGPGSVVGLGVDDLADRDGASPLLAVARGETPQPGVHISRVVRRDGDRIDVEVAYRDLRDDPTVHGVVLTLRDVTQQHRLERELTHRALHDALTGLPNRVLFQDRVQAALEALEDRPGVVGVLLVDLDDFKLVNDTVGHTAGDDLLVALARRLESILRAPDTAARLGGDEFAVLVPGAATAGEVEQVAAGVVGALGGADGDLVGGPSTSVSVGIATAERPDRPAELLRRADLALYAAKGAGKGRWHRYTPELHLAALDRLDVRTERQRALGSGQFELRYQPIVDLLSGATRGLEALVRWHHPRRGTLPPGDFVRIAEETGLILPLGAWVLDRGLADVARWRRLRPQLEVHVSINVSARQIRAPGFVGDVLAALRRWSVPADAIILEITETALLAEDVNVAGDLAVLREHGVRIALDDFGTGYSSLDYIRVHGVDILKIDRSFVAGMEDAGRQRVLVGAVVNLARTLGLAVIAEGIETPTQRDALVEAGCRLGQGYLYAGAISADAVVDWLPAAPPAVLAEERSAHPRQHGLPVGSRRTAAGGPNVQDGLDSTTPTAG
jgi:diguanylate cyclase (GGDEF)-like protein/PAS domain S-box-containing protein